MLKFINKKGSKKYFPAPNSCLEPQMTCNKSLSPLDPAKARLPIWPLTFTSIRLKVTCDRPLSPLIQPMPLVTNLTFDLNLFNARPLSSSGHDPPYEFLTPHIFLKHFTPLPLCPVNLSSPPLICIIAQLVSSSGHNPPSKLNPSTIKWEMGLIGEKRESSRENR